MADLTSVAEPFWAVMILRRESSGKSLFQSLDAAVSRPGEGREGRKENSGDIKCKSR